MKKWDKISLIMASIAVGLLVICLISHPERFGLCKKSMVVQNLAIISLGKVMGYQEFLSHQTGIQVLRMRRFIPYLESEFILFSTLLPEEEKSHAKIPIIIVNFDHPDRRQIRSRSVEIGKNILEKQGALAIALFCQHRLHHHLAGRNNELDFCLSKMQDIETSTAQMLE